LLSYRVPGPAVVVVAAATTAAAAVMQNTGWHDRA